MHKFGTSQKFLFKDGYAIEELLHPDTRDPKNTGIPEDVTCATIVKGIIIDDSVDKNGNIEIITNVADNVPEGYVEMGNGNLLTRFKIYDPQSIQDTITNVLVPKQMIYKTRYSFEMYGSSWELEIYRDRFEGLCILTVDGRNGYKLPLFLTQISKPRDISLTKIFWDNDMIKHTLDDLINASNIRG